MRELSLRKRVARAFGAFAALLVILLTTTGFGLADLITRGNDVVYRWQPATDRSQAVVVDLVNEETGVRGYALTGQSSFLAPYTQGRNDEQADLARLRQLISPRPALVSSLDVLQRAIAAWHAQTAEPIVQRVGAGQDNVASTLDAAADKARFDAIRSTSAGLTQGIAAASRSARNLRREAADVLVGACLLTGIVVVAGGVLVWRSLHTWVLTPVDALAAQTRVVASGRTNRAIRPVGPPEIEQLGHDVEAMRNRIAEELAIVERTRDELARSNADLEQFAYVASHDLSEPLRKVANFCQLLERQYGNQLDDRARQYIAFAVDGAKRMQVLIEDLLTLSRVGRTTDAFVPVDTGAALDQALTNLEARIAESGAGIGRSDLPTVLGDPVLVTALFENLVGNSIKYRGVDPPLIVVTAVRNPALAGWEFAVKDNGIGIDPQYRERIFAIFQRLHLRDKYGGTGIGLALCRKIVEFHGGRIWLDSSDGGGATFRFTIPDRPASERRT